MFKNDNEDDDLFLNDIGSLSQIYTKRELYGDRFKKPPAPKGASFWDHKKANESRNAAAGKASSGGDKTPARGARFDDDDDDLFEARKSDKRPALYEQTPRRFEPSDDYEPEIGDVESLDDDDDHRTGSNDFEEPTPRLLASSVNNYAADMGDLPWRKPKGTVAANAPIYDFEESARHGGAEGGGAPSRGAAQKSRAGAADDFSIEKASFGKWFEAEEKQAKGDKKAVATELLEENYPTNVSSHYDAAFKHKQPVKLSLDGRVVEERSSQNGSLFGFKQREFGGADEAVSMPPPTPRRPQLDDDDVVILDDAEAKAAAAAAASQTQQQRRSRFSEDAAPAGTVTQASSSQPSNATAQYSFATPTSQGSSAQQHIPTLYPTVSADSTPAQSAIQSTTAADAGSHFVVPQTSQAVPNPQMVPPPAFAGAGFRRPPGPPQGPPPNFVDAYHSLPVSVRMLLGKSIFYLNFYF